MGLHGNAKLGPAGRRAMVMLVVWDGFSRRQAAARHGVCATTAKRWVDRYEEASGQQRCLGVCFVDRSSRPYSSPRQVSAAEAERICAARQRTGWGPRLIAGETGHPHATVSRCLQRAGLSRLPCQPRGASRRYEWPCPGDLLHIDTKRFARFTRPGHAVTGDRHRTSREQRMRVGYEWVHSLVDDHSRLAYSELHPDQRAATVTGFVTRGLAFFAGFGITPKRLMSDNAWIYTRNASLARMLAEHEIRHLLIPPRRPQTNGKVERYQQTMKREWAHGHIYRSSDHRADALPYWLRHYNEHRPHSSLGGRPPISRIHNVSRQDI
jgi:transposase InsO family protein